MPRHPTTCRTHMDFAAALGVLQQRVAAPYTPDEAARPANGEVGTATTGDGPLANCAECATQPVGELAVLRDGQLLRLFLSRQEERVGVYRQFEEGFKLFLQVAEAQGYEALVQKTTATFRGISAAVNAIETELRARGSALLPTAETLRRVQGMERQKLELTARLHILRHGLAVDTLQTDMGVDEASANAASRTAPLRAEEAREVEGQLEALREQLNDAIDEVRCELCDELDEEEAEAQ